ncbi:serine hydrolase domain-containing protein [Aquimarina sp. 2201CG5-10]|uniref:serine hydrolase domain-containing protein n=1 Tax=Aquimarina callyspongiae TaxID=3098150 RepID=UPI002AB4E3D2|nr:serine hydrolase domain-containing protein [Aquimarina sp. 2201CG5-10]MDY8138216.1 serine hydrolase domain-containing protein [Aquimarina sp. 2201CG5-10]
MIKRIMILFLLISHGITAQGFNKTKLDSLFTIIQKHNKGMGSFSIFQNGKEVYRNSIGYADVNNNIKADQNTKYRIGSITKTFTATMILQLIDEKKLTLATLLSDYFPEIPNASKITIEHLLRHRSGLYNLTNDRDFVKWMVVPQTRKQMMNRIIEKKVDFEPDEKTEYSNTNYLLLSYILEDIEGKSYANILQSRIVIPCKLENTCYGGKIDTSENEALSYDLEDEWTETIQTDMSVPMGAGGIIATPTDLNTFYHDLFNGKLISESALDQMKTIKEGLGMGVMKMPFQDKEIYGHNGKIDGFQSLAGYFTNERIGVSYIANGLVLPIETIVLGALQIYIGADYELPDFKPAMTLKKEDLEPYLGMYSSPDFPMEIEILNKDAILIAKATGKPLLPLEPVEKDKFKSDRAMLTIEFVPKEGKLIFERGQQKHVLTRK